MFDSTSGNSASASPLRTLLTSAGVPLDGQTEVWGPVVAVQLDHSGTRVIQRYVTVLVRRHSQPGGWLLVRQVSEMYNGWENTSRPVVTALGDESAQHWLVENRISALTSARF